MTSIRAKYRPSSVNNNEGTLFVQIIHNRASDQIKTGYSVRAIEWDEKNCRIRTRKNDDERGVYLSLADSSITHIIEKVRASIKFLDAKMMAYDIADIMNAYRTYNERRFFVFMENTVSYLHSIGKLRTSETYASTMRSFKRFRGDEDIDICMIDSDIIEEYEAYLQRNDVSPNTIAFYMRILKSAHNRCVQKGLTGQNFPFRNVSTRTEKTAKRAIGVEEIKRIRDLKLSDLPDVDFARDMFLFSFYTRGMSFVDMAYLRKMDLKNGVISYRRRKTRQQLSIKWEDCMQDIVNKYIAKTTYSPFLLPIIRSSGKDREKYLSEIGKVNLALKKVAGMAGITTNLTTYVARHSWASIAKSKNIPISVISEGMGHESESTTQIYLASLDSRTVDDANKSVINL